MAVTSKSGGKAKATANGTTKADPAKPPPSAESTYTTTAEDAVAIGGNVANRLFLVVQIITVLLTGALIGGYFAAYVLEDEYRELIA